MTDTTQAAGLTDEQIDKVIAAARDELLDHIYEYGTTSEGVLGRVRKLARAALAAQAVPAGWATHVQGCIEGWRVSADDQEATGHQETADTLRGCAADLARIHASPAPAEAKEEPTPEPIPGGKDRYDDPLKAWLDEQHPDDAFVESFAYAMKLKLAKARDKGRGGWQTCPPEDLSRMLRDHVEKGDPVDVANFCMFLYSLKAGISAPAEAKLWCIWECSQTTGTEWIVSTGSDETEMRRALMECHERGRDVWLIAPDGSKHLPEVTPAEAKEEPLSQQYLRERVEKQMAGVRIALATPQPQAAQPMAWRADYPTKESEIREENAKAQSDVKLYGVGFSVNGWHVPAHLVSSWGMSRASPAPALTEEQEYEAFKIWYSNRYRYDFDGPQSTWTHAAMCDAREVWRAALRSTQGGE